MARRIPWTIGRATRSIPTTPSRSGDKELVFDLGGNVAEWIVGADGEGKLMGGSADRPADPKARGQEANTAYRGFRVIRGGPPAAKAGMD